MNAEGANVTPVAYRENMTFRINAAGRGTFAFRVHQANYRTDAHIQSELDMMAYLNSAGILTPVNLGWCAKKTHMPQTAWMKPLLLSAAEKHGSDFLRA